MIYKGGIKLMSLSKIWLKEDVFDWEGYLEGGSVNNDPLIDRPYKIWEHSKNLFKIKGENEFHRADGILNLKRSINHRLQYIEQIYQFKTFKFDNKPKGTLELLETFGLVRPYIMKQLFEIRNDIEHRDFKPPNIERCNELLDVVWYFLKSTDTLVQIIKSEFSYTFYEKNGYETHYHIYMELNYGDINKSKIHGWLPEEYIRYKMDVGYFCVVAEDIHGKEKWKDSNNHQEKLDSDKRISGVINFEPHNLVHPVRKALSLY